MTERAAAQLDEYFSGVRTAFDIPLHLAGTAFQSAVWRELLKIPYGETLSYSELAARAGSPKAVRAAGCANGANPVSIFVPCHRIVGSGRGLVGYGGGLPAKKMLLEIESRALLRG